MGQYLIRVEGRLSDELVSSFPTLDSSRRPQTVLHGAIEGQGGLDQILSHLRAIGVEVIDVHRVGASSITQAGPELDHSDTSPAPPV